MQAAHAGRRRMLAGAIALLAGGIAPASARERVVDVVAKKFAFVPAEIRAARGEALVLRFTAPEVPMGVNLADFGLRADVVPGQVATLRLVPEQSGRFEFVCDVFCGGGHEEMSGTLVVG